MIAIVSPSIEPIYRPRRFAGGGLWEIDGCHFKVHLLSYDTTKKPFADAPNIVAAARGYCSTLLPEMDRLGEHFGIGYIILHEGYAAENYWLLFDWWIPGGIHCRILSRALNSNPTEFKRVHAPYVDCIWEAISATYEREQWIANVLSEPRDPEAYLQAGMPDGLY